MFKCFINQFVIDTGDAFGCRVRIIQPVGCVSYSVANLLINLFARLSFEKELAFRPVLATVPRPKILTWGGRGDFPRNTPTSPSFNRE